MLAWLTTSLWLHFPAFVSTQAQGREADAELMQN